MEISKFISEEVTRQGHDINVWNDGGIRCLGMLTAWTWAQEHSYRLPALDDVLRMGYHIEPERNHPARFRKVNVRVGINNPPVWGKVAEEMAALWNTLPLVKRERFVTSFYKTSGLGHPYATVDDFYLEFERIHPFADGNGRVGKVLYNWILGTLDDPVLVDDYFGGGNP